MKVVEISEPGGPSVLRLADRDTPDCGDKDVLIQVAAAGVNRPDVIQRMGLYPPPPGASDLPGLEVSGTIVEIGSDVTEWKVGDRVCALVNGGGYAEQVSAPAGQCLAVPSNCSWVEAASLPETFFTVWTNVFDRGRLRPGESLLVHGGSSGIGVAAIQMATALGSKVYVTAGSQKKCRACIELGAIEAINYREQDFAEEISRATNGVGVDVILDMVGGSYVAANLAAVAVEGRIVNIAFQTGSKVEVNLMPVMLKRLTMTGSTLRPQSAAAKAAIAQSLAAKVWPLLESGSIKPVVACVFPLAEAAAAHTLMESSSHIGKIVLSLEN